MIFYVYLDPDVILRAQAGGEYGMQTLIAILSGFLDNCFVAEFYDESVQATLKENVKRLPEGFDRKRIMVLLNTLKTRNRFIYCLTPDYSYQKSLLECVREQAGPLLLDLVLLPEVPVEEELMAPAAIAALANYQFTRFEDHRRELARDGVTLRPGELSEDELLERYFKKALMYARSIEICDRMFGRKYNADYKYTIEKFFQWLARVLLEPDRCSVTIHCEEPDDQSRDLETLKTDLTNCKIARLITIDMKLFVYQMPNSSAHLPHDRFIITDQIAIGIPRGMGFLDPDTGQNRDLTLDYKNRSGVQQLLNGYVVENRFDL